MSVHRRAVSPLCLMILIAGAGAPRPMQPEDRLLDPSRLRGELLRRGMTDLLQVYLEECPPTGGADKLIYERQRQLAIYADKSRDEDECLAALDKAIALLTEAISTYPDDERVMDWRLELGKELIYKRAEPYYNNILFRGGSKEDREQLLTVTTRATQAFDDLIKAIDAWNRNLQQLSERALARLENSGQIARYRTIKLNARYFASWAQFYRALAAPPGQERDAILKRIITYLTVEKKDWIEIDHTESGVQCQSLLLLGMTYRLAGDAGRAVEFLTRAVARTAELTDPAEKRSLRWVTWLGRMEQVKVQRDSGEFDKALAGIRAMTKDLTDSQQALSVELAAALLEGSIYERQAAAAKEKKDLKAYARLMGESRQPLIALATRRPQAKARIYASIYPLLGKDPPPSSLGPFDKSVYVAGLLGDAARAEQRIGQINKEAKGNPSTAQRRQIDKLNDERTASLEKAIETAKLLLADKSKLAEQLRPEAMMNLAVCYFQRGHSLRAVQTFSELVDTYPRFDRARDAVLYAVQIAAELNTAPASRDRPEVRKAFIEALRCLTDRFGDSDEARYWRFFLANTLELEGNYAEAAEQYAKVDASHENYLDAQAYRINCLVRVFEQAAGSQSADPASLRGKAKGLSDQALSSAKLIISALDEIKNKARRGALEQAAGGCLLTAAQLSNDPPLKDYRATLNILEGFEQRYGAYRDLIGRALRLRIVALQGLNQIDKARQLIPDYVKRDPENAGVTLSALLATMQQEVERARQQNRDQDARKAADEAAVLAEWLYKWAQERSDQIKPEEQFAIRIQLAQAYLEAQRYEEACKLFEQCVKQDAARSADNQASHGPALFGLAESRYQLGQVAAKANRNDVAKAELGKASKGFLAIWRRTTRHTPLWWWALLRGLEVPVALNELSLSELEAASRNRSLSETDRQELAQIAKTLDQIERTVNAERMGDEKLGGHSQAFNRMLNRVTRLRERVRRLSL